MHAQLLKGPNKKVVSYGLFLQHSTVKRSKPIKIVSHMGLFHLYKQLTRVILPNPKIAESEAYVYN